MLILNNFKKLVLLGRLNWLEIHSLIKSCFQRRILNVLWDFDSAYPEPLTSWSKPTEWSWGPDDHGPRSTWQTQKGWENRFRMTFAKKSWGDLIPVCSYLMGCYREGEAWLVPAVHNGRPRGWKQAGRWEIPACYRKTLLAVRRVVRHWNKSPEKL